MKKFLSLLLALTMVLSLTVVPARADTNVCSANPASVSLTVGSTGNTQQVTISGTGLTSSATYGWNTSSSGIATVSGSNGTATITAVAAGNTSVTCQVSQTPVAEVKDGNGNVTTAAVPAINETVTIPVTVTDPAQDAANTAFGTAITLTYGGRNCAADSTGTYVGYKFADADRWAASVGDNSGFTVTNSSPTLESGYITVNGTQTSDSRTVTVRFKAKVEVPTVTVTAKPATITKTTGIATITASAPTINGVPPTYTWTGATVVGTGSTVTLTGITANTTVTCTASYAFSQDSASTKTIQNSATVNVDSTTYDWSSVPTPTLNMAKGDTNTTTLPAIKLVARGTNTAASGVTYTYTSSNPAAVTVDGTTIRAVGSGFATITITAKDATNTDANYRGKLHATTITVSSTALEYSLGSVTNGSGAHPYSYDTLRSYAASVINTRLGNGSNLGYSDVTSLTVKSGSLATLGGSFAPAIGPLTSAGLTYTAPDASIGKASITLTATTARGNFDIAYNISVTPISWTFETVTAEPIVSNSAYYNNTYKVTFPTTTFNQFYVVNKTGVAPADYSSYNLITGTTSTTLNATDFNSSTGTCTLFVIAWNSNYSYNWSTGYSGKYYCGPITVTQTNHDIKYNGVVGGTVQFKHNDFTTFMNETYGTNTTSYLTFNSVKFTSVPNATTQGTLYYNGVAMTTGYGSNYFNTSTAVTNLDNVSFSVSSRVPSTTKEIRIPFTLYATRYNSYGTSAGTSVTYSGVVVISLVREDVTFTVAPGDSVRFTDSAFLTYLRSASGINYNYNIDYVTFDQSAVNALNEGVLYAYSTGFNAVKTTDRFYYTTTNYNQNALSDVTFRASTYAKTGTTVYIPFTIYAKYGTSSATRQVTGTVAIKIAQTMNFVDVKTSDYFYDSVKWAVNNNITKGTSATTFSPNNTCTRAEIVTFLWRAAGSKTPTITRNPFTDVAPSMGMDYYYAILWASQNGIAAGTSATTFSPNATCTRAQIVTFLWRYSNKPAGYYSNPFTDVNKAEHAAYYDAILWAVGKGITKGTTATTFSPYGTCTRGEAVTFLYRAVNGK